VDMPKRISEEPSEIEHPSSPNSTTPNSTTPKENGAGSPTNGDGKSRLPIFSSLAN